MDVKMNKRGQIFIFIILAMIIVVLLLMFFLLRHPPKIEIIDENNPQAYLESCTEEAVEEAVSIMSPQGGDISPNGSRLFNDTDIVYHCYNDEFYEKCINQRPLLVEHMEGEITNYITPIVAHCFDSLEKKLSKRYDIQTSGMIVTTRLYPDQISVTVDKNFKMTRGDKVTEFKKFRTVIIHPLYNFADITMEIVNQEIKYCNFDILGYMILYPRYDIERFVTGDSDVIYTIRDSATGQLFRIAVKGCILPPGYG